MIFTIYKHINKKNGKVYIGQTIQRPEDRWKNGAGYKTCTKFYNAIQKYGWDNFEHIILEQKEMTQEEANELENFYIKKYNCLDDRYGYNITEGGYKTISDKALPAALEWMKKHPDFGKARAQDMLKWQKEHPEEALEMRRKNQKEMVKARSVPVQCIETGIVYASASEAARQVPKTTQSKICMVCRGQRNTCGGFHWEYYKKENNNE